MSRYIEDHLYGGRRSSLYYRELRIGQKEDPRYRGSFAGPSIAFVPGGTSSLVKNTCTL